MITKQFTRKVKESLKSFSNDPGFGVAILAIGNTICNISASARRRDARGFGTKSFKQKKISGVEACSLVAPSTGSVARTGKSFLARREVFAIFPILFIQICMPVKKDN